MKTAVPTAAADWAIDPGKTGTYREQAVSKIWGGF